MAFHKALKDLNLLDRFLFAEAMEDPVIMQTVLEIIFAISSIRQKRSAMPVKAIRSESFSEESPPSNPVK